MQERVYKRLFHPRQLGHISKVHKLSFGGRELNERSYLSSLDTISYKTSWRVRSREPRFATKSSSVSSLQEAGLMMRLLFD